MLCLSRPVWKNIGQSRSYIGFVMMLSLACHAIGSSLPEDTYSLSFVYQNSWNTLIKCTCKTLKNLFGVCFCVGKTRARDAALNAIQSPLLDIGIERATGIVWNITGGSDLTLFEVPLSTGGLVLCPCLSLCLKLSLASSEFNPLCMRVNVMLVTATSNILQPS